MSGAMPAAPARSAAAPTLVIEAARLFTGNDVLADARVVVAGDTIVAVESRSAPPPDVSAGTCRVLRFPDATVLPGLIDAHLHLSLLARAALKARPPAPGANGAAGATGHATAASRGSADGATGHATAPDTAGSGGRNGSARKGAGPGLAELVDAAVEVADSYLARGVTTLRDLGDRQRLNLQVRQRLAGRDRPGPRVLAPGRALHRDGLYGSFIGAAAADVDGLLALAEEELAAGADFVKVVASGIIDFKQAAVPAPVPFTPAEIRSLVDLVHARGKRVAAHASGAAGVAAAVAGGVDSLEHGFFAENGPAGPVAAFARGTCTWVPTFIPVEVVARGAALTELTDPERAGVRSIVDRHERTLRTVYEAGGAVVAGSDAGSPGVWEAGGVYGELRCFVRAGLPLRDVLAMATARAAAALGIGNLTGSLTPGRRADLVVVTGDPLASLDALDHVRLVLRDGVPLTPQAVPPAA